MEQLKKISKEEQETIIIIDYYEHNINFYTSKPNLIDRFLKLLGEPSMKDRVNDKIVGITYKIPLFDTRIKKVLSITNLIEKHLRKEHKNE